MTSKTLKLLVLAVLPGVAAFFAARAFTDRTGFSLTHDHGTGAGAAECEPLDARHAPAATPQARAEASPSADDTGSAPELESGSANVHVSRTSPPVPSTPRRTSRNRISGGLDLPNSATLPPPVDPGGQADTNPFRAETSDEFKDPNVVQAKLSRAFDDLEFEIDVREVDCTDVPCIAYGELPLGDEYLDAAHSAALAEYGSETKILKMGARYGDSERQLFGFALLDPEATGDELRRVATTLNARNASYFRSSTIADESAPR